MAVGSKPVSGFVCRPHYRIAHKHHFNHFMESINGGINVSDAAKPRFDKIEAHMFLDELHTRLEHQPDVYVKLIYLLHSYHKDRYVTF